MGIQERIDTNEIISDYREGYAQIDLAEKYHMAKKTVRNILTTNNITIRGQATQNSLAKLDLSKWEYKDTKFQPKLSKDLFYIIGILYGDGDVSIFTPKSNCTHYKVELSANDKSFVKAFIKSLRKIGISHSGWVFVEKKRNPKWNDAYKTRAYSKVFAEWYKDIDLNWIKNNAIELDYKLYFIRGIYESEGSLLNNNGYRCIEIVNTDRELMELTKKFINDIDLNPTLRTAKRKKIRKKDKKVVYKLGMYRDKEVQNLLDLIKPCIRRKIAL